MPPFNRTKCPQCTSTNSSPSGRSHLRCNVCGFKFHTLTAAKPTLLIIGGLFIFSVLSSFAYVMYFDVQESSNDAEFDTYEVAEEEVEDEWHSSEQWLVQNEEGDALIVLAGEKNPYTTGELDRLTLAFLDPLTGEEIKSEVLSDDSDFTSIEFRTFESGEVYMIASSYLKNTTLYRIDPQAMSTEKLGYDYFPADPKIEPGIFTIDFVYHNEGDGFLLTTNLNETIYYYPAIQTYFTEKEFYEASEGFASLPPEATSRIAYVLTDESSEFPDEPIQLMRVEYKAAPGYPRDGLCCVSWGKDYGGAGIFTSADPYEKRLYTDYQLENKRILNFEDFTPGESYSKFSRVLYYDESVIIKANKQAINQEISYLFEAVDVNTTEVLWALTRKVENGESIPFETVLPYKNGYYFIGYNTGILLDKNGSTLAEHDFGPN